MKFCWVTVYVKDMKKSLAFYRDVVGLDVKRTFAPMPGTEIAFLGWGETEVELICSDKNKDPRHGKDISLGFEVTSLEERIALLKSKGITDIAGPFQPGPRVKFIYIDDPDGVRIQFVENVKG